MIVCRNNIVTLHVWGFVVSPNHLRVESTVIDGGPQIDLFPLDNLATGSIFPGVSIARIADLQDGRL